MNVLVVCEESQAITNAFRELGVTAFSLDIQSCSGGHPEYHIKNTFESVENQLNSKTCFVTEMGQLHSVSNWDLIIAHPPCTYLSKASATRMFHYCSFGCTVANLDRYNKMLAAKEFFLKFYNIKDIPVIIENPIPLDICHLPKYNDIIEPWQFGEPYTKATCLWYRNGVKPLKKLYFNKPKCRSWTDVHSYQKTRSKTFPGIANAIAAQFANGDIYADFQQLYIEV